MPLIVLKIAKLKNTLLQRISLGVKIIHGMKHRQALVSKTLPENLVIVLSQALKVVNAVEFSALNSMKREPIIEMTLVDYSFARQCNSCNEK